MNVLALCDPEAAAVPVESTVADAIRKMLDFHVGAVAIVDNERRVAGIFTERDAISRVLAAGRDPVGRCAPVTDRTRRWKGGN